MTVFTGLIGKGIQRSKSPAMHEAEAAAQGFRCIYELIDLDERGVGLAALPELLVEAETRGFAGVNITYPCKQAVIPLLHDLSDEARAIARYRRPARCMRRPLGRSGAEGDGGLRQRLLRGPGDP